MSHTHFHYLHPGALHCLKMGICSEQATARTSPSSIVVNENTLRGCSSTIHFSVEVNSDRKEFAPLGANSFL